MIAVLTHHWVKKGKMLEASQLLEANGLAQSKATGFILRHTLYSKNDQNKITSLVIWINESMYNDWKASPERKCTMAGAYELWANPPKSERFLAEEDLLPYNSHGSRKQN